MYTKIYPNSKISHPQGNNYININNIFKQINTNIITPNQQRRKSLQGQNKNGHNHNASFVDNNSNLNKNYKKQLFLNGTLETEDSDSLANQTQMTQMYQRTNINNNNNYKTSNKENNKTQLNRYNSYGRMKPLNNGVKNNKTPLKNKKKTKGNNFTKIIPNGKNSNNTNRTLKKNVFIPLGNNNKFHTIADNKSNGYCNFHSNINKTQIPEHNTIEVGKVNLYNQMMLKKYNINRPNGNNNQYNDYSFNYGNNKNINTNNNHNKINYNFTNIKSNNRDISRERKKYRERPKTPDHFRMEKSSNNRKPKTPDRQRTKGKFNLNKEYFCPTMENVDYFGKKNKHNNGIDNYFDYQYQLTQDAGNKDYFSNYNNKTLTHYYQGRLNTNDNFNTLTSNNSNKNRGQNKSKPKSRKTSSGRSNPNTNSNGCNNTITNSNKTKRRLIKNASQGNIRHNDNHYYLITNNNNNNTKANKTKNYNGDRSHSKTPEKINGTRSKYPGVSVPMTQLKDKNSYGIYGDTFQSFGKKIPTINELNNRGKNFDYNNKYFYECNKKNQQNQNYVYNNNNVYSNDVKNLDKINSPLTNIFSLPTSDKKINDNKKPVNNYIKYVQRDFSSIGSEMSTAGSPGNCQMKESYSNEIDFNEMDQFSPPYASGQVNLESNINSMKGNQIQNQYTNIGIVNENNKYGEGNRKVIDDFIKQLGNKGNNYL